MSRIFYMVQVVLIFGLCFIYPQRANSASPADAIVADYDSLREDRAATEAKYRNALMRIKEAVSTANFDNFIMHTNIDINSRTEAKKLTNILFIMRYVLPGLYREYDFSKLTDKIRIIALNDRGYRAFLKELGYDYRQQPYGFASKGIYLIALNTDLGAGTLLHEVMHILIYHDLQKVPAWIGEGFACLYERAGWKDGRNYVKHNWRLPVLKRVINTANYIRLINLIKQDRFVFEGKEKPAAQARYIMYYLYEKGILGKFYKEYKATRGKDYYGIKALETTLGINVDQFEQKWLTWVNSLSLSET